MTGDKTLNVIVTVVKLKKLSVLKYQTERNDSIFKVTDVIYQSDCHIYKFYRSQVSNSCQIITNCKN